jgi:hypothetical protein
LPCVVSSAKAGHMGFWCHRREVKLLTAFFVFLSALPETPAR